MNQTTLYNMEVLPFLVSIRLPLGLLGKAWIHLFLAAGVGHPTKEKITRPYSLSPPIAVILLLARTRCMPNTNYTLTSKMTLATLAKLSLMT
jgi:hypothetical protein